MHSWMDEPSIMALTYTETEKYHKISESSMLQELGWEDFQSRQDNDFLHTR